MIVKLKTYDITNCNNEGPVENGEVYFSTEGNFHAHTSPTANGFLIVYFNELYTHVKQEDFEKLCYVKCEN